MSNERTNLLYMLLDDRYYADFNEYVPTEELICIAKRYCLKGWEVVPGGYWTYFNPSRSSAPEQGWKIHISGRESTAKELLERVTPILAQECVSFKFCADLYMVRLSTSKWWPRTGVGKFITIYPATEAQFVRLLALLHAATLGFKGPYILTDRPYENSETVFYRYGGHSDRHYTNAHGEKVYYILDPNGNRIRDERVPYFKLPPWVVDPMGGNSTKTTESVLLGRYRIDKPLKYSAYGGVYTATDVITKRRVVLREGRPELFPSESDMNPINVLKKEARVLQALDGKDVAPGFIDLFEHCGHWFLVMEHLDAETLWGHVMNIIFVDSKTSGELFVNLRRTMGGLIDALSVVHESGIVMRDLTRTNVLFEFKENKIKFIDFEFAFEMNGNAQPFDGWTSGFASPEQIGRAVPTPYEDYYALGALMLDMIAFTATGLALNRSGVLANLHQTIKDFQLPMELNDLVLELLEPSKEKRCNLSKAAESLRAMNPSASEKPLWRPFRSVQPRYDPPISEELNDISGTVDGIVQYLRETANVKRKDRLWPISYYSFITNPVSFEYGASGIAWFLYQTTHELEPAVREWIIKKAAAHDCPPGLWIGLSGIATALLDLGDADNAVHAMEFAATDQTRFTIPGLYNGTAGWGLANLYFWSHFHRQSFLDCAMEAGDFLLKTAETSSAGMSWVTDGITPIGLGFGASGIALFFSYLYAVTGKEDYMNAALRGIDFEMSHAIETKPGLLFFSKIGAKPGSPKSPHMRFGTAGVGTAALRVFLATKDQRMLGVAKACVRSLCSRYTNKIWDDYGLAGWGQFLLDMYQATGEDNYLNQAHYLAMGILPHRINTPEGITFLGGEMLRICCDFGEGAAGVGYFLARLRTPTLPRPLLPDQIFFRRDEMNKIPIVARLDHV